MGIDIPFEPMYRYIIMIKNNDLIRLTCLLEKAIDAKHSIKLLCFLFTDAEISNISQRLEVTKGLLVKTPQRKLAHELKVSFSQITRGSNELKNCTKKFKDFLIEVLLEKK